MLIRISLIAAIVFGLATTALNFVKVKEVMVTTMNERDQNAKDRDSEKAEKVKAQGELKVTKADLATTKTKLAETETDLKNTTARANELEKKSNDLTATLEKTRADRDAAQQKLAVWDILGVSTDQVKVMMSDIKKTKEERDAVIAENKILNERYVRLDAEYKRIMGVDEKVILPTGLKGNVIAVDPKYDFVVLNIGGNQGVLERGEMLVNRKGKLIAKVRIFSVEATQCVANVLPGWKQDEIIEGDQVLY